MVKYFFESNNISFTHNKPISLKGSIYRPDFSKEVQFGYLIEVDEHQHKTRNYNQCNEIIRIKTRYQDIQLVKPGAQVLFIRFNPDEHDGMQSEIKGRYNYLYTIVMHFIGQSTIGMPLGKIMLYYDEFNGNPIIEPII